jgi:hypothetical protein
MVVLNKRLTYTSTELEITELNEKLDKIDGFGVGQPVKKAS